MELKPEINGELNQQLNEEFYSAYVYLAMAAYCEDCDLTGFANWMKMQYQEELLHAEKFYNYINDRDGRVLLKPLGEPQSKWNSPLSAFEDSLVQEKHISECINKLAALSIEKGDHATHVFLQWFVNEQVEEEKTVRDIIHDIKLVEKSADGIFMIDRELAQRAGDPGAE